MIALFAAICYWFFELLKPPKIKQIRFITRDCVSKIVPPIVMKMATPFQDKMWFHNTFFLSKLKKARQLRMALCDNKRDSVWQQAWLSRVTLRDRSQEMTKPLSGVLGGCSCLASARAFTSSKWGFHRWQGGSQFHILPLGARFEIPRDFWAPPCYQ